MSDRGSHAGSEKGSTKDLDESIGATLVDGDDEDELAPLGGANAKLTAGRLATLDEASGVELLLSKKDSAGGADGAVAGVEGSAGAGDERCLYT